MVVKLNKLKTRYYENKTLKASFKSMARTIVSILIGFTPCSGFEYSSVT